MIRAHIIDSVFGAVVNISLVRYFPDSEMRPQILHFASTDDGHLYEQWHEVDPGAQTPPTLRLQHEEANALLAALHNHYQGVDDQRRLRKDYDHERSRVDKLTDVVTAALAELVRGHRP